MNYPSSITIIFLWRLLAFFMFLSFDIIASREREGVACGQGGHARITNAHGLI